MAKTVFIDENPGIGQVGTTFLATFFNKIFGLAGHVHDGVDDDGHAPIVHWPLRSVAADAALNKDTDCILLVDASGGPRAVPTCHVADVPAGRPMMVFKKDVSANAVTITDPDGRTINGDANYQLTAPYEGVWIAHDGADWIIINKVGG